MRAFDQGSLFRVTVSAAEVDRFNRRWPCSTLAGGYSFTFDKRTGDLVDLSGRQTADTGSDLTALSHDAQRYGAVRLGIPTALASRE
jgi:hypothetical protein